MTQPEIATRAEVVAYLGLGQNLSEADAGLIEMLKGMVENQARQFCRHNITQPDSPYEHFLPAQQRQTGSDPLLMLAGDPLHERQSAADGNILQLPQIFVRTADLEVRQDQAAYAGQGSGDFGDETLLTVGTDYYLDVDESGLSQSGRLVRIGAVWPSRPRTVKVVYRAGFTAAELDGAYSDIKYALIDEVAVRFRLIKSRQGADGSGAGAIRSESIGGEYSVTYDVASLPESPLSAQTEERLAPYMNLAP